MKSTVTSCRRDLQLLLPIEGTKFWIDITLSKTCLHFYTKSFKSMKYILCP